FNLLAALILASGSLFAQINPTSSPYYTDGIYSITADSSIVGNKKIVMYKPSIPPIVKYPVLLFQPGANGLFGGTINVHTYDLYLKHLASYGFVTMVIDETSAGFPSGTTMSACLTWVKEQARSSSGHWLANYADTNKIVVGGHSNGGVNACETLADNPLDVAGIVFFASYPSTFPTPNISGYTGKVLNLAGEDDESSTPSACYTGYGKFTSSDCKTWVLITGMGHGGFGDYVNTSQPVGFIGRDNATATVRHYLVSFMLSQFKNNTTAANNLFTSTLRPNTTSEFETSCSTTTKNDLTLMNEDIFVYPNPAIDKIFISMANEMHDKASVKLYNATGQICAASTVNNSYAEISLENLPVGMYLIRVESANSIQMRYIIKQ
ncbi:MAG: hypothetical protein A2309_11550, partial [Bacteroidetes bacterium RIFOXYB2_FULL_35_7]